MHKPSGLQIGPSQWAAASRATPSTPERDYVNTRSVISSTGHGKTMEVCSWHEGKSPLASITSAIEYVSDPQVEPFALLTWAVTTTRRKSKKNPDLWEENYHSGPWARCSEI